MSSNSTRRPKIIGRDFALNWIVALLTNICIRMLDSNMASYATYVWDSKSLGGYMTSFFTIGSVVMSFFSGRLNDAKGRRNCLMAGCIMYAVPAFLMTVLKIPEAVLACRLVQGAAKGLVMVSNAAIIADVVPHDHMNRGMGIFGLASTVSFAFGPMLGLAIVGNDNRYLLMFAVCGILYVISAATCLGITYEKKQNLYAQKNVSEQETPVISPEQYKGIWKLIEKKAILPSIVFTIFISGYACIVVFATVYAQEMLKLSGTMLSLFYTTAAVTMMVIRMFISKLADRYGAMILLVPGHIAMILSLLILAFWAKNSYALFLIAGGLYGIGVSAVFPGLNTVAVVDSPKGRGGAANATYYFMMDIGMFAASAIFGAFLDNSESLAYGYRNMFLISAGITAVSFILSVILFNNRTRARRSPRFAQHMMKVKNGELDV